MEHLHIRKKEVLPESIGGFLETKNNEVELLGSKDIVQPWSDWIAYLYISTSGNRIDTSCI